LSDIFSPYEIAIGLVAVHQHAGVSELDQMLIDNGVTLKGHELVKDLLGHCRRLYAYLRGLGWTLAEENDG